MSVLEKLMTAEEFARMPHDGKRYDLVDGMPVEVCRPKPIHGKIAGRFMRYIGTHVDDHDLGMTTTESGYVTKRDPDNVRGPDIAYISKERLGSHNLNDYIPTAPDLVIEVVSEFDTPGGVAAKIDEYLKAGARLVWVAYPEQERVGVYQADGKYHGVGLNETLDGGDVLPGFEVTLRDIWQKVEGI